MKTFKKFAALLIAALMVLAMAAPAMADGTDGTITLSNATVGVKYKAYKILDATIDGDAIAYTTTAALKDVIGGENSPFTVSSTADSNGNYAVTVADGTTAETISDWITSNIGSFEAISATTGTVTAAGDNKDKATQNTVIWDNLAYGYYYVTSGLGSAVSVDSANPDVTIVDKNPQEPGNPDKEITGEDAENDASDQTGIKVKENDAAVGSVESFEVKFNATNYYTTGSGENVVTKLVKTFNITDTPRNLEIIQNTVKVVVGDKTGDVTVIENGVVKDSTNYPATIAINNGVLQISLTWIEGSGDSIASIYSAIDGTSTIPVTLTYDATILPGAATENADNTVTVDYDRSGDSGDENIVLPSDHTDTKTYKVAVKKTDENGNGLTGAKFQLKLNDVVVDLVTVDETTFRVANSTETGNSTFTMSSDTVTLIGLDLQDYTLTEIEAPKGYNLMVGPTAVSAGILVDASESDASVKTVTVINNSGTELPSTGGMGTTIFYAVGSLFVLGGVVVLIARRKVRG